MIGNLSPDLQSIKQESTFYLFCNIMRQVFSLLLNSAVKQVFRDPVSNRDSRTDEPDDMQNMVLRGDLKDSHL